MKYIFLLAAWMIPGLALAEGAIPQIVKNFGEQQGIKIIKEIDSPGGVKGWVGQYQDMGVTLFLTPDGKHVISGYLYDDKGQNLSEGYFKEAIYTPLGREMWKKLNDAGPLKEGADSAARKVIVFADPFCPYCKQFWQQARPWVDSGKVQLRTLLVGVIKPESPATAAAILASKDPAKTWQQYEASGGKLKLNVPANVSTEQMKVLSDNEKLMDDLGANVTPAIYYMSKENTLQQAVGLPDQKTLNIIMGNK